MQDTYRHKGLRRQLVMKLKEKGISDQRVLDAIGKVPRHVFFDPAFLEHAYQDKAFPIGEGQTISQPYTVAFQTQLLEVKPGDKVLEVGTGSGYQCCVLMETGAKVYSIETNKVLYQKTREILPVMGYNPKLFMGDGTLGLPTHAPFDKIIVTAGAPAIPETYIDQLVQGGILVIPVGNDVQQHMLRVIKTEKGYETEDFGNFKFVPLIGKKGW